jgi:hypothetical protein
MAEKKDKKWISKAIKRPGAFSAKAKRRDMTVAQFRTAVLKNPTKYSDTTVRQARLAQTLSKINKKKKK